MRGRRSNPGDTRVAPNGYHNTYTADGGWRLTHHILIEMKLGRALKADERVEFIDKDRTNLEADNLRVVVKGASTKARERARITTRIADLEAQLRELGE
jgi:hypothetical protein